MGLRERLIGRAAPAARTSATPPAQPPIAIPYLDSRSVAGLSAVWRCVSLIADVVARWPWQEWRGDVQLEPSRLVRRPMATMGRREWVWRVVATEALMNTTYLLHVGGTDAQGAPWSLLPVPPSAIAPVGPQDPYGILPSSRYAVGGQEVSIEQLTIIRRAPWPGVPDHLSGILSIARRQFTAYLAADTALARYWLAGGPVQTVITTEQELTDPQADQIANRWVSRRALGSDFPAVLGKGAHAEAWGADPSSESSVDARNAMVADIGRYFGVPTRILNAPANDSETYSNVEFDALDLTRYTLAGYVDPIEEAISELLPGDPLVGRRMVMDPTQFVSGDLDSRATAYASLVGAGIVTAAEARVRGFGLPPTPPPVAPAGGGDASQGEASAPALSVTTTTT